MAAPEMSSPARRLATTKTEEEREVAMTHRLKKKMC
jgi:hypothetical protein